MNLNNLLKIKTIFAKTYFENEIANKLYKYTKLSFLMAKTKKSKRKNDAHIKKEKKSTLHKETKEQKSIWQPIAIILTILVIILAFKIIYELSNQNISEDGLKYKDKANSQIPDKRNTIELVVIEDSSCDKCNVDSFTELLKKAMPELEIIRYEFNSKEGLEVTQSTGLNFVPIYMFSTNINERDDWESLQSSLIYIGEIIRGEYYLINPNLVIGEKKITKDIEITQTAITLGNPNANVTIYEFSDYECIFCALSVGNKELNELYKNLNPLYKPPMPNIFKDYIETGKAKFVFYNFPIEQLHPQSIIPHMASLCANEQNKWKEFNDKLFEMHSDWINSSDKTSKLEEYASEIGLNTEQFNSCLESRKYIGQIKEEVELGITYGVSATPSFFVNRNFMMGNTSYDEFKEIIEQELAK